MTPLATCLHEWCECETECPDVADYGEPHHEQTTACILGLGDCLVCEACGHKTLVEFD